MCAAMLVVLCCAAVLPAVYVLYALSDAHTSRMTVSDLVQSMKQVYFIVGGVTMLCILGILLHLLRTRSLRKPSEQLAEQQDTLPCSQTSSLPAYAPSRLLHSQLASVVFDHSLEGIMITDAEGNIVKVNTAFTHITGYSEEECQGENPRILKTGMHDAAFYDEMWRGVAQAGFWEGEIWNRHKNGEAHPHWISINAIRNQEQEITNYIAVFHDITDKKEREEQDSSQAHMDALTGLPNRQIFREYLEFALAHGKRYTHEVGVLFLDLDKFKNVNDSLGHNIGDVLLQESAKRLKLCCRGTDRVARLSGDEFMILLPELKYDGQDTLEVAQRILKAFSQPFHIEGHEIISTVSIGITIYPTDGEDVSTLERNADIALYKAKEHGRNTYVMYTKAMHDMVVEHIALENHLRKAIENEEFEVYYQPKVDVKSGTISGVEALVRWNRSVSDIMSPDKFIPLAEETGLILQLGEWVLRTACKQVKTWQEEGFPSLSVAVNLSAKQFQDEQLVQTVETILREIGLDPNFLRLEITENTMMHDIEAAVEIMSELETLGVHLSIDDFGTGYSSLSNLKHFPLDELKIDKSFVRDIPGIQDDVAIAKAILSLAHNLNMKVLAEGVEKDDQLEFMRTNKCDEIQGFLISKPVRAGVMRKLLQDNRTL